MNIKTIKNQLDTIGYVTNLYDNSFLAVGEKKTSIAELPGWYVFNAFCSVKIEENKIKIKVGRAGITTEDEFTSISRAVKYIKSTFPL